jgi:hypothetical protein
MEGRITTDGGGLHFGLVHRALCIFAPHSSPSLLLLTAATLYSQGRVVVLPLAVAAGEDSSSALARVLRSEHTSAQSPHSKRMKRGWQWMGAMLGLMVAQHWFVAPHDYAQK